MHARMYTHRYTPKLIHTVTIRVETSTKTNKTIKNFKAFGVLHLYIMQ